MIDKAWERFYTSREGDVVKVRLNADVVLPVLARKGLSQNALARQIGITSGYMSQLLRGRRCVGPGLRARVTLAPSLRHVPYDELFEVLMPDRQQDAA
jgi:transcriptional regulator with XRE-family HTH domain